MIWGSGADVVMTAAELELERASMEQPLADPCGPASGEAFSIDALRERAAAAGLEFPDSVLGALVAALRSGKHVILTGPPGTGKTTLAMLVSELARESLMCSGFLSTTATSNWSVDQTVGGIFEGDDGPAFRPGVVLDAIESGRWLLIDELNRADIDRALGEFFTVLSGQPVVLPFKRTAFSPNLALVPSGAETPPDTEPIRIPKAWRIVATMNDYDRNQLFQLSHALMRRFAFVHLGAPTDDVFRQLVSGPGEVVAELLPLRQFQELGPAIFIDASEFAALRLLDGASRSAVLLEVFNAYFLAQLDGTPRDELIAVIEPLLDEPERHELGAALERLPE